MDYFPLTIYTPKPKFWPEIDNALRAAAINNKVKIKMLISWWNHSRTSEDHFLKSLADLTNSYKRVSIEVVSTMLIYVPVVVFYYNNNFCDISFVFFSETFYCASYR